MEIEIVTSEYYKNKVIEGCIYNNVEFINLNAYKVEKVEYILFKDTKYRLGLILGIKESEAWCPFSAPFAFPDLIRKDIKIKEIHDAIRILEDYLIKQGCQSIKFILPPPYYMDSYIEKLINALFVNGYYINNVDLDYYVLLNNVMKSGYKDIIHKNAKRNLNIALKSNLTFRNSTNGDEIKTAYDIIRINHENKNYPMRMSYQQVKDTINIIKNDFFIISYNNEDIAAALLYYVNSEIVQMITWGDKPGFSEKKPMNYLAYQLIQYYHNKHIKILDFGPSTENSIPNYGLCDFKESFGCSVSNKFTMKKEF